ncbi:MAG TPA: DUF1080 domain-containing protein [Bryobacteraceae bacterium]|nr:DUF1080 domain-containing protein [Bryobacteraceae bacterium]
MRNLLFLLLFASSTFAGDGQFNGRWDIQVINEPRNRAWWLEVNGAGTKDLKGRFVGFPGGNINDIPEMSISGGVLTFRWNRGKDHQVYHARLQGEKLQGDFESGAQKLKWIGHRAPTLSDKDDGSWKKGKPVPLFDGKSLDGWQAMVPGKPLNWTVKDGILSNTPAANNLISDKKFWNFELHAEFRVSPNTNSGIGLRGRYEVQILDDFGKPPNTHGNGALYSRILPSVNASRPPGEWQTMDIRLVGRQVTITLNGKKIIDKGEVEGLTAMANNWNEAEPGPITVQGDHRNVEFRALVVTPLVK